MTEYHELNQVPWHRRRHLDTDYVGSFDGGGRGGGRDGGDGPSGKMLMAFVHWPVSISAIYETLGVPNQWPERVTELTHAEVAGVSVLLFIAGWSILELARTARKAWRARSSAA